MAKLQAFRDGHERLGIDLDKFERQMASYQLSGDPSVLLTLGERTIRELGEHLAMEEEFVGTWERRHPARGAGIDSQDERQAGTLGVHTQ